MCLVNSSTSIDIDSADIDSADIGVRYRCMDCETKFHGLGKKINAD